MKKILITALCICYVVFSLFQIIRYAVNIPNADDYGIFLGFINGLESSDSMDKKVDSFFSQQNEHRPFTARLISFLQFKLTGKVNFILLLTIGNILWMFALLILKKIYKVQLFSLPFLALLVLFLNMNHWENMLWATGSLQNFGVIFFTVSAFYFCFYNKKYQWLSILLAGIAFYTSGNGLFALLVVTAFVLFKAKWWLKISTIVFTIVLIYLYFINYKSPGYLHSPFTNLTEHPLLILEYILTYFAGSFYLIGIHDYYFILIAGVVIVTLSIIGFFKTIQSHPITASILAFCLLSGLSVGLSRAEFGYLQAVTPRYQVINTLLYFTLGMIYLRKIKIKLLPLTAAIGILVTGYFYAYSKNKKIMVEYHHKYLRTAYCHSNTNIANVYVYPIPAIAWIILVQSETSGVYKLPKIKGPCDCTIPNI